MEVFDFDYHTTTTKYPESGTRLQLGNSYTFSAGPTAPDQRIITLHFNAMRYFTDETGALDATVQPKINFLRLENFYTQHRLWLSFEYEHPIYGLLICKFNKPLETPKMEEGSPGWLQAFTVEFLEIP